MPGQLSTWIADRLLLTSQKGACSNQFRPLFSPLLAENKLVLKYLLNNCTGCSKISFEQLHRYSQRSWVRFPFRPEFFFFQALFLNCLSWVYTAMIFICLKCIFRSTNIWLSCILIKAFILFVLLLSCLVNFTACFF